MRRISEPVGIVVYVDSSIGEDAVAGLRPQPLFIRHRRREGMCGRFHAPRCMVLSKKRQPACGLAGCSSIPMLNAYFIASPVFSAPSLTPWPTSFTPFLIPCPVFLATCFVSFAASLVASAVLLAALLTPCSVFLATFFVSWAVSLAASFVVLGVLLAAFSGVWAGFPGAL